MLKVKILSIALSALFLISCANELKVRINPNPQKIEIAKKGTLKIDKGFKVEGNVAEMVKSYLTVTQDGVPMSIIIDENLAQTETTLAKSGAYILNVSAEGILITAYDERGAFYAVQTLRQLSEENTIPYMTITDYPDMPYRGVVEGFYGNPWSHATRVSLIDFYGKFKMNSYSMT